MDAHGKELKMRSQRVAFIPTCTPSVFSRVKTRKYPEGWLADKGTKKMWSAHSTIQKYFQISKIESYEKGVSAICNKID